MGKMAPDAMIDAALAYVAASTKMTVCKDTPTTFANATGHADVGGTVGVEVTMTAGDGGGDYAIADDGTGVLGRKLTMTAKNAQTILHDITATHIALTLAGDSTLRYVTTCTSQALTAGGTVDIPSWKIQIGDPT
jgi:hypothetical protein